MIILPNRDGADLRLEYIKNKDLITSEWQLKVDNKHKYCLEYIRVVGSPIIEAVDPSGGPFITLGGLLKDVNEKYYKIVEIVNPTTFLLSETN